MTPSTTARILALLAESSIHPGAGLPRNGIDLPVAREAATDYPFVPGSGVKGALRQTLIQAHPGLANRLFGTQEDGAGSLLVSDARLLLLPVRSLTGAYKWLTCPHLIERYRRDRARCGAAAIALPSQWDTVLRENTEPPPVMADGAGPAPDRLFLEEWLFEVKGPPPDKVIALLKTAIADADAADRLANGYLAIVSDDEFAWFARHGLAVQARNRLRNKADDENDNGPEFTKKSLNLWYEETLPPDTVLYLIVAERQSGALADAEGWLNHLHYLQLGGNETIGQGWFQVQPVAQDGPHG